MPVRRKEGPRRFGKSGPVNQRITKTKTIGASDLRASEQTSRDERTEATRLANSIDDAQGFERFEAGKPRTGWLCNMHSTTLEDAKVPGGRAAVDFYFIGEDETGTFKASVEYDPYFLIAVKKGKEAEVEEWVRRGFEGVVKGVEKVEKEDLKMPNHLLGYRRTFLKLNFANVNDLLAVRRTVSPIAEKNRSKVSAMDTYAEVASASAGFDLFDDAHLDERRPAGYVDASDFIVDIREYDVPYHVRVAIDLDIRVGKWYTVEAKHGHIKLTCLEERLTRADPVVMAFDIETTKLPLKFPDASIDQVMMISYMIDGQGFLITNREIVSEDISDFDYTPKPEFDGPFLIFNEPSEEAVLTKFFECIKEARPTIMVTYNGDFFDWPFVEARASVHGIDMYREIGFRKNSEDIYQSTHCAHMDAFAWVNRDSYLPQGSRGLKAVTVAKLGYDPDELDPELMTPYAAERPQVLAEYSVSDAVATYYLYMKYVHPFIFSLCTIIPLGPDDVLRKGTGTLCEMLLMVQAYQKEIVLPNKHVQPRESFWEGHLLESETYVGGHVESIEAGVFRSDIPCNFAVDPSAIDELLEDLDAALTFSITVEEKKKMEDVANYDEVKAQIAERLLQLKNTPNRHEKPSIYHLDVASMYPNIMTTNRLQPDSMIDESVCAACDFNRPGKTCDRRMPWSWRGEFLPAKRDEYNMIRHALENERFPPKHPNGLARAFQDLSLDEQTSMVKKRLTDYSKKIYHKIHDARTMEREAIICQRENPFYVDTVKDFRDRRYDFKGKQKVWKGKTAELEKAGASSGEIEEAKKMIVLFDSLQLAHKVILNSFYGYVMRKGSRWYSMEMAGVTCLTGARIIQMARQLVERIGRPLELDTDGIWCILPATFPENFAFTMRNGKKMTISYPCVMLNHLVHAKFTNHQYQTLKDPTTFRYETHSDNTIFFEVDGPYKAMILPTSKEEDKNLKKRYAVFNHDGSLAELKGFEVKRRGELKLIKIFQQQIFKFFLEGATLEETYAAVAKVADKWLDVLHSHGSTLADEELIDLICENKSMTKTLEEYGAQKSTAITTAKRLAEFLGEQMVKDKGLNCKYIIASRPKNSPVTERAIPVAIFSAEESVKRYYLRKWMKEDPGDMDPRTVIDWDYYLERLGSVIQKLITIPAALQKVRNPVPRVAHPDWLDRRIRTKEDRFQQVKMTELFQKKPLAERDPNALSPRNHVDMEDFGATPMSKLLKPAVGAKIISTAEQRKKRKERDEPAVASANPYDSLPEVMPSITEDYQGWLRYQKKKWKIQKAARIRRRQLFGEKRVDAATDGLGAFFRQQAEMLYTTDWQILQLRDTETAGVVSAFVLIGGKVSQLKVVVPRQLFLNLKEDDVPDVDVEGVKVEKVVNWTLPNGHASTHLFQLTMNEQVYVQEAEKLGQLFNHASVEGVYERKVPLNVRAMLELGCVCTFDESQRGVLGRGLEQGFELSALRTIPPKQPYMAGAKMSYLALYHIAAGDRQIYALFSSVRAEAKLIVLSRARSEQGMPNVDRIYEDVLAQKLEESGGEPWQKIIEYQDSIRFTTVQVTTQRRALQEIADAVKKFQKEDQSGLPTMMVLQSQNAEMLVHDLPILQTLPILKLSSQEEDKALPPLGWQSVAAKRLVSHYLNLGLWISHLLEFSRYGNVPICNLERDDPRFLIDITYARRLQKEKVVLWWSDGARPDHAGHEKDDVLSAMETIEMPSVNNPGTYSSVCIDLNVKNLAINTILSAAVLNDAEGASDPLGVSGAGAKDDALDETAQTVASENAFAAASIAALREMVKGWWQEACAAKSGSTMADVLVQHLLRWIESPSSHLFDRNLLYYVQIMSRKAFQQLMGEFRRVGSHVVFASAGRLLLQTSKAEVGNAFAYSGYILKTIAQKPAFHFLDLSITEYWDYLVWYDEFNYGGKGCTEVVEAENQSLDTIMHWQIATFLPLILQPNFNDWVVEYIELMHARKRPAGLANGQSRPTQLPIHASIFNSETDDQTTPGNVLAKSLSMPLKKQIAQLIKRQRTESMHEDLADDWRFPSMPGSHLNPQNPVLELVKSIMQVLSLDKTITLEARLLRKELLQLFEIREFSAEGSFANPSTSLCLRQLSCPECCVTRDIDLCRDTDLNPNPAEPSLAPRCESCGSFFDPLKIQEMLIGEVQRQVVQWVTQDLKCRKCGRVRTNEFAEHCGCAGEWVGTIRREEVGRGLRVLGRVGEYYGMSLLSGVVEGVLKGF
ncbi:DNA polymerase epsilon catalytic subunit A [Teratosphaeria destructans]|uniref:DNA polymerase epsilon catalytic subunit n=1 Tax=Teratosphaeria destructans TaxID=418781 RepID=A0A9W7STD2_9PEZI|nr:DNA polymerase epsilon catalytic subunit A [Teratosphaeria destructans]